MTDPLDVERDFRRYLAAKRTVDDRALDRRVFDRLRAALERRDAIAIVEIGAGIGAMVERLLALDALPRRTEYTAVDVDPATVETARNRLPDRLERAGYDVARTDDAVRFERGNRTVSLDLVVDDAVGFVARERDRGRVWDLLVGHAVLDVIGVDALPTLLRAVPGGFCYFPITFDGATRFEPPHSLDRQIERRYHRYLDGKPDGSSRAGRRTLRRLQQQAVDVLAVGGSDWVVYPVDGDYPAEEAYFLHYSVDTIEGALADDSAIPADALTDWTETRHRQIDDGELTYVAHQLDMLGRVPSAPGD